MKRDIDLARQLLFDIEAEGPHCAINRLRTVQPAETAVAETADRVRYHLRLLIDAGLVKEIDRTDAGTPCVRLTNSGHELTELARSDARWRDAKQFTRDATGGLSLTVIRAVLTKWAVQGAVVSPRGYGRARPAYRPYYHRVEPRRRYDAYRYEHRDPLTDDELRLVRTRPDYLERYDAWDLDERGYPVNGGRYAASVDRYAGPTDVESDELGVSLPIYVL